MSVSDTLSRNNHSEAVLHAIQTRRPDTSTAAAHLSKQQQPAQRPLPSRATDQDDCIDTLGRQLSRKRGAKECAPAMAVTGGSSGQQVSLTDTA